MSEPTSLIVAILLFLGGLSATVDPHLLTGAFAGGTLFVLVSTEYRPLTRVGLMLVSILAGYLAAPELQYKMELQSGVIPAIIVSALLVTGVETARRLIKKYDGGHFFSNKG